MMMVIKNRSM